MMGGLQSAYVREVRLWKKFDVFSSIETWQGSQVIGRHRFVLESGGTAAIVMTTAGVYDVRNRRFLEIDEVIAALGHRLQPRDPSPEEQVFMISHQGLRALGKSSGS